MCRIDVDCLIQPVIARKIHRCTPQNIVVFTQDGFGIVHRQVMGEITINLMIILQKILSLRKRNQHGDQREAAEDPRKADHNRPGERELFTVKCHEL